MKTILTYARALEDYPEIWVVLTEKEVKADPTITTRELTAETMKKIMMQAGMVDKKGQIPPAAQPLLLVNDPESQEPMALTDAEVVEDAEAKPMTLHQLETAIEEIENLDQTRLTPGVWDETPVG